ncbi:MAG: phosphoribosylanthranilate isomerase [Rubricoccaceae bacterium]|nr:phosphoribosylanthranilate isomerase [Rubricoccaceae bacterium]
MHIKVGKVENTKLVLGGITRLEDARYAAAMGVDFLGIDLSPALQRYLDSSTAKEIAEWISGPKIIGSFAVEPLDIITQTAERAGCTWVQLNRHPERKSLFELKQTGYNTIAAFQIHHDASAEQLLNLLEPVKDFADLVRIDTSATSLGGEGKESINWRVLREIAHSTDIILAGAFSIDETIEACELIRPFAMELTSTLESSPGIKDFDKMGAFFDKWDRRTDSRH